MPQGISGVSAGGAPSTQNMIINPVSSGPCFVETIARWFLIDYPAISKRTPDLSKTMLRGCKMFQIGTTECFSLAHMFPATFKILSKTFNSCRGIVFGQSTLILMFQGIG